MSDLLDDIFRQYATILGGGKEDAGNNYDSSFDDDMNIFEEINHPPDEGTSDDESFDQEKEFEEEQGELDFQRTYADIERTTAFGHGDVPEMFGHLAKYMLSEKDITRIKIHKAIESGLLGEDESDDDIDKFKRYFGDMLERISESSFLNLNVLIVAAFFIWKRKKENRETIKEFLKDKPIEISDFIRYLRFLSYTLPAITRK